MLRAVLTTHEGHIEKQIFCSMDEFTDHLKKNRTKYEAILANVIHTTQDIRQGRDDRKVTPS